MTWGLGEEVEHAPRAHVDVPFVGVKAESGVPVQAVQPEGKAQGEDEQQGNQGPGEASVKR